MMKTKARLLQFQTHSNVLEKLRTLEYSIRHENYAVITELKKSELPTIVEWTQTTVQTHAAVSHCN